MSTTAIKSKSIYANGQFLETTINSNDNFIVKMFKKLSIEFEEAYYLNAPIAIMLQSVIGGIAAMFILANMDNSVIGIIQLGIAIGLSSIFNALILGQVKAKIAFKCLVLSIIVNTILIVVNV